MSYIRAGAWHSFGIKWEGTAQVPASGFFPVHFIYRTDSLRNTVNMDGGYYE